MLRAIPPVACGRLTERSIERCLSHFTGKPLRCCMYRGYSSGPIGQYENVAPCQPPLLSGCILDSDGVLSRHERAQGRQICQKLCRAAQAQLALALKILEGTDRILEVGENFFFDLPVDASPHQQKTGAGKTSGD